MGAVVSSAQARRRIYRCSDYFNHAVLPRASKLIDEIEISRSDASQMWDAFGEFFFAFRL